MFEDMQDYELRDIVKEIKHSRFIPILPFIHYKYFFDLYVTLIIEYQRRMKRYGKT